MCIVSMVSDHYHDKFPWGQGTIGTWPRTDPPPIVINPAQVDLTALRKLIDEFKEAIAAAAKLDVILKQPDCVDPAKAELQERVARLEKVIDALLADKEPANGR